MYAQIKMMEMQIGDTDENAVINGGEQAPKDELHVNRGAAENPDKEPGNALEDWVRGAAHDREGDSQNNGEEHRRKSQFKCDNRGLKNAWIKEIFTKRVPVVSRAMCGIDYKSD